MMEDVMAHGRNITIAMVVLKWLLITITVTSKARTQSSTQMVKYQSQKIF
jgi:hypothetical protein